LQKAGTQQFPEFTTSETELETGFQSNIITISEETEPYERKKPRQIRPDFSSGSQKANARKRPISFQFDFIVLSAQISLFQISYRNLFIQCSDFCDVSRASNSISVC
jgi:hypothetical protein